MSLSDKVVVVTGASSGIGEALAREAARQGAWVVLAARREDRIQRIARELETEGRRALAVRCDVTSDSDMAEVVSRTTGLFGGIDVLMANAGFGVQGRIEELSIEDYQRQFDTNVYGVIRAVKCALPELKRRRGAIGVVGSANGYLSIPGWSAYCMSKHAVQSLCACIRHELSPDGVSVTHLAPGFVESEFRKVDNHARLHADTKDGVPSWLAMPSATAARAMLKAVLERREEAVITLHARLVIGLERHAPRLVSAALGLTGPLVRRFSKTV
jgi:short-subunit dehydrogenase